MTFPLIFAQVDSSESEDVLPGSIPGLANCYELFKHGFTKPGKYLIDGRGGRNAADASWVDCRGHWTYVLVRKQEGKKVSGRMPRLPRNI